jgi:hypothetical protein
MPEVEISQHAQRMLEEREIPEEWMWRAIHDPDRVSIENDDNMHYVKAIAEYGGRYLRVIVNPNIQPNRIVTLFFDRRLGRKDNETEG